MEIQRRPIRFGQWVGMPARSSLCFSMRENGIPTVCPRAVTVTMEPMVGTPSGLVSARSDRATYSPPCTGLSGVFREVSQKAILRGLLPARTTLGSSGISPGGKNGSYSVATTPPKKNFSTTGPSSRPRGPLSSRTPICGL